MKGNARLWIGCSFLSMVVLASACQSAAPTSSGVPTSSGATAAAAKAYPSRPIEFISSSAAGSSVDTLARSIASGLTKASIVTQPINIVNKTGGAGATAMAYVMEKKGDDHTLFAFIPSFATAKARGLPFTWTDFTMVANLEADAPVIGVRADTPYKTLKEFLEAAKAKGPGGMTMGLGVVGNTSHQVAFRLGKLAGVEFNYVGFNSGAEGVTALLGGNVDFVCEEFPEMAGQVDAGKIRILGGPWEKRIPGLDVPTFREQGYDLTHEGIRGVMMPPGVPSSAVAFWESALEKGVKTPEWQQYLKNNFKNDAFMKHEEFAKVVAKAQTVMDQTVAEIDLGQKK